ncbi:MAG: hypothetical protein ACTSR8_09895 [Promethearchaeota archaeon]
MADAKEYSKEKMYSFYLEDPKYKMIERELNNTKIQYFYFNTDLKLRTQKTELLNGCLLKGDAVIIYEEVLYNFDRFDFFFLPPNKEMEIKINSESKEKYKICLFYYSLEQEISADFEIAHFSLEKYLPRGEFSSEEKMATYRTVWTAIKNGYFMSGFTNIPNESLKTGVITSVNLEQNKEGKTEIFPHIHPDYPEVYIMCIDDDYYAISQYMINIKGQTVCKDLSDGEGLFFPGSLGHSNFARPLYKELKYCQYLWIIPTFGQIEMVAPITLRV